MDRSAEEIHEAGGPNSDAASELDECVAWLKTYLAGEGGAKSSRVAKDAGGRYYAAHPAASSEAAEDRHAP